MTPQFVLSATVLDARDPHGLAGFYQRLLGWESGGADGTNAYAPHSHPTCRSS